MGPVSDWLIEAVVLGAGRISLCARGVLLVFSILASERGEISQN